MRHIAHARKVLRVVEGRGELRDAATDGLTGVAVDDDARLHVALGLPAGAGVAVEGERIARRDDGAIHLVGYQLDVAARVLGKSAGGELTQGVVEAGALRVLCGEGRRVVGVRGVPFAALRSGHAVREAVHGLLPVQGHAVGVRDDALLPAGEVNVRVALRLLRRREGLREDALRGLGVDVEGQRVLLRILADTDDVRDVVRGNLRRHVVAALELQWAVEGAFEVAIGKLVHRLVADGRLLLLGRYLDAVWVEPVLADLGVQLGIVNALPDDLRGLLDLRAVQLEGGVLRLHRQLVVEAFQLRTECVLVHLRVDGPFLHRPEEAVDARDGVE